MASTKRDSQRAKLYAAEQEVFDYVGHSRGQTSSAGVLNPPAGTGPIPTHDELQAFVNKVFKSRYVQRKHPHRRYKRLRTPEVHTMRRDANHAYADLAECKVCFPPTAWLRSRAIVLHECAHIIADQAYGCEHHGWEFAMVYLDLVRHFMGQREYKALKAAFRSWRVRFAPKRTRNYTPEQREAMRERARLAREAKWAKEAENGVG